MTIYLLSIFFAVVILALGEKLGNQTKDVYIKQGHDWGKVILYSNIAAIISGLISVSLIIKFNMPVRLNPYFVPFATAITSYLTIQSIMTDLRTHLINRNILRVGYLSMFFISIYNIVTNDIFKHNATAVGIFTGIIVILFFFSPIGASDIRALAVALPYVTSIGGYLAIELLLASLLLASLYMLLKREKLVQIKINKLIKEEPAQYKKYGAIVFNKVNRKIIRKKLKGSKEMATPVGPFMIMPFMIFLVIYPVLVK